MKLTSIKKLSPSKRKVFIRKADRALQDWFRATYPNKKCESCGAQFQLMHHFLEKSRSTYLRYTQENLIFLCHSCHAKHHLFHDQTVMARVVLERGEEWFWWIETAKRKSVKLEERFIRDELLNYGITL